MLGTLSTDEYIQRTLEMAMAKKYQKTNAPEEKTEMVMVCMTRQRRRGKSIQNMMGNQTLLYMKHINTIAIVHKRVCTDKRVVALGVAAGVGAAAGVGDGAGVGAGVGAGDGAVVPGDGAVVVVVPGDGAASVGDGADEVVAGDGADVVVAGDGADVVVAGDGADVVAGDGADVVVAGDGAAVVVVGAGVGGGAVLKRSLFAYTGQ